MRLNKQGLIIAASIVFCAMAFSPKLAFAAASVSISGPAWDLGAKGALSGTTSAAAWTVTNDSSGTEDVLIKVSSTGTWTASTDGNSSANKFILRRDSPSGQIITAVNGFFATALVNNGAISFGFYFCLPPAGSEEGAHTLTVTLTATNWFRPCGSTFSVTHTAGTVAPVTKTVTYGTVATNLTGSSKCWITQNLGADNQATSATDATEPSAGWYWQFNRTQGFKHDGTTRTPTTTWDNTNDNTYTGWDPAKDPCTLLLGTGWRLPTYTEWGNADANGAWGNYNNTFASVLKLHTSGTLDYSTGSRIAIGGASVLQSSSQSSSTQGWQITANSSQALCALNNKAQAIPVRCLKDLICGESITVTHTAGTTAPVTKTVTYGTVATNLTGSSKCWITQNLGADNQASSATDATEPPAGWYWQFNRTQGYKHDGTTRTPTPWVTSIDESSDWIIANDPCTLLLGTGWRLPTYTEWVNANANGGWGNYNNTFVSVLKLHAAGYIPQIGTVLSLRGTNGQQYSSTQANSTTGWCLVFNSSVSTYGSGNKATANSVRCLKDFVCGENLMVTHTAGTIAPVTKNITYGTVSTNLTGAFKCWITQNLGADNQASSATDATESPAGWYWQFNRIQGFKHDGTTRTPTTTWDSSNDNTYTNWDPAKDPCTLLLGTGWRLPTFTEWTNTVTNGGWVSLANTFDSVLKLHAAGFLLFNTAPLTYRGQDARFWSSTQNSSSFGYFLYIYSSHSAMDYDGKGNALNVRCLKD